MATSTAPVPFDTVLKFTTETSIHLKAASPYSQSRVVVVVDGKEIEFEYIGVGNPDLLSKFISRVQADAREPSDSNIDGDYVVNCTEQVSTLSNGEKVADRLKKQAVAFIINKCDESSTTQNEKLEDYAALELNKNRNLDLDVKDAEKVKNGKTTTERLDLAMFYLTKNVKDEQGLKTIRTKILNSLKGIGIKLRHDNPEIKEAIKLN